MNHRPAAGTRASRQETRRRTNSILAPDSSTVTVFRTRSRASLARRAAFVLAAIALPSIATASLVDLTATTRPNSYDDLERAAAAANQAAYDALLPGCGGGVIGPSCNPAQLGVFEETRELVHTANEILANGGPTQFSLSVDDEGLGNALRWTAAEEVAAQSRAATDFSNGQVSNVQNRITALRFGARGFSIAGLDGMPTQDVPALAGAHTLGSAGEATPHGLSRLGGFVNGSFGWGQHDPTTFEDAFDYESWDITVGVDYRVRDDLVLGLTGGYAASEIDFDASKSVVDGGVDTEGFSLGAFGTWSWESLYVSGFLNYQRMDFDIDRFITYPSLNPDVEGTNTQTNGETESDAATLSVNLGYTQRFGLADVAALFGAESESPRSASRLFVIEPSVRMEYFHLRIAEYTEANRTPTEYFALTIQEQELDSLELALGLRFSAALSTSIGVAFPYVRAEWRFETIDENRGTTSNYDGIGGVGVSVPFALGGGDVDRDYFVVVAGLQAILRAGGSRTVGGAFGDRLSGFVEYRRVFALENVESQGLTGGLRYLF